MENYRNLLETTITNLSISGINSVASYANTEKAIAQAEKQVFTDYQVMIGGSRFEFRSFTVGYTLVDAETDIILVAKSASAVSNLYATCQTLLQNLYNNRLGDADHIINSQLYVDESEVYYNEKLIYTKFILKTTLYVDRIAYISDNNLSITLVSPVVADPSVSEKLSFQILINDMGYDISSITAIIKGFGASDFRIQSVTPTPGVFQYTVELSIENNDPLFTPGKIDYLKLMILDTHNNGLLWTYPNDIVLV